MRNYLKELRRKRNLLLADVAEKLDITESSYCLIENGKRQKHMDISMAAKLAQVFEVPLEYIIEEEGKLAQVE